uniref:Granulins domain-containing protein n=1 Tax=Plectus sambesii TaxID=2011161 RepID=A0A914VV84_9BILA
MKYLLALVVLVAFSGANSNVICPDHKSQCPTDTTCCLLDNESYGCCPLPNAVCCDDHQHCCPEGATCNTEEGKCDKADGSSVRMHRKQAAQLRVGRNEIVCGDHQATCPTGTTCCQLDDGQWGCCPLPEAVCCNDHRHCCPHGTTCDTQLGRCNKRGTSITIPWSEKIEAKKIRAAHPMAAVTCPDKQTKCMGHSVCCTKTNGQTGCCPFVDGVCCANGRTCCPYSFTCDNERSVCLKSVGTEELSVPWQHLPSAIHRRDSRVVRCPDASECPSKTTCCPTSDGSAYSCCPLHKAVCCEHSCCAKGFKCAAQGKCEKLAAVDFLF